MHAPPHLLYGARAHGKLGHLVEARELYLTLGRERLPDAAPRVFREAQQAGDNELAELEARIPYVSVVVQGTGAKSVRVTRNDEPVPVELVGVPHPVNPGEHRYQAFADGMESTPTSVQLKEGVRETVVLTLRALEGAAASAKSDAASSSLSSAENPIADSKSAGGRPLLIGAFVGFGVGAIGVGLGSYFIVKSGSTQSDSDKLFKDCKPRTCTAAEEQKIVGLDDDVSSQQTLAIVGFVAGGVGLATGVTLLLLDAGRSKSGSANALTPVVGLNYAGLKGSF